MLIETKLKSFDVRPIYERNPDFASESCGAQVLQSGGDIYVKSSFFGKITHANLDKVLTASVDPGQLTLKSFPSSKNRSSETL